MPPKAKAGVVAQLIGTTSIESPKLGGRPKKQKVAFEEAAKDIEGRGRVGSGRV